MMSDYNATIQRYDILIDQIIDHIPYSMHF